MRRLIQTLTFCLVAGGAMGMLAGCQDDAQNNPDAATAQEALGITPGDERQKSTETTADVEVVKQTKVIDKKTGEVLSEKTESTPVTIQREREVKTDVDVKVGETQSTVK